MNAVARWVVDHPLVVIFATVVVTAVLASAAIHIRIEGSLENVLPTDDPEIRYYNDIRASFGSDDIGVVGVRAPDLFATETLEKITRVTDQLAALEGVERVVSITNAVDPAADVFNPPLLLPDLPLTAADVSALKAKLLATPIYANNLVGRDFTAAAINVFFANLTDAEYADLGIDEAIRQLLVAESGPEEFFYTGAAHVKKAAVELMRRDLFRFTPIALALVLIVLWLSFRRLRAIVLPFLSVTLATVWTLGVMVLAGKSLNLGTFMLPPLLLVIGSSYGIHVLARYYELVGSGIGHSEALLRAIQRVWPPLLISAFTTAVGFGALMTNRITAIWDLGLFSVVGLFFLTVTSLTLLPAALQLWGIHASGTAAARTSPRLQRFLTWLGGRAYDTRAAVLVGAAVLAALALAGLEFIRVDSDFLAYFDPSSPVRKANETINQEIVGTNPFFLVVESSEPGALERWEVLKQIRDLQSFLASLPGITASMSIVDYLELLEAGLNAGATGDLMVDAQGNLVAAEPRPPFWQDPTSLEPVWSMVRSSPDTFRSAISGDFTRGNIVVRTTLSGSREIEDTLARIRDYIAQHFPAELSVHPTGALVLLTGTSSEIVAGQVRSLALALVVIFLAMAAMFLSVRVGMLAILPNALAIVVFFGILGWLGIFLNLGTSLIATIALGIAVDSTIHYMTRLSRELKGEADQSAAMRRTMSAIGIPVVYTTVALFFGFLTFAVSNFVPIQSFGLLAAVTLAAALVANLVVLPAALATTKIITLWDLVGVKLGEDPAKTIPLLAGLRPAQARIVVLMGELRRFSTGEAIVRRGELGNEMYVILEGTTEVWGSSGEDRRRLALLHRGEVFGEMALVRQNERSADVIAAGEVEVLAVDRRFLQRIQSRYPRIAAKVFLNLTRILSDRLERLTDQFVALPRT